MIDKVRAELRRSCGMTLVEMMVAIGITSVIMVISMSIFTTQLKSYQTGKNVKQVQQSGQQALDILQYDLLQAGWSVLPEMAFFIQDGGTGASDLLVVNDASVITLDTLKERALGMSFDCPGGLRMDTTNPANPTIPRLDIDDDDDNGDTTGADFIGGVTQYVITDNVNVSAAANKVAIVSSAGASLGLDRAVGGTYVAPAIFYCADDGSNAACTVPGSAQRHVLRRSDRSSGGRQPIAENVVDLQITYRDTAGNWYGLTGCVDPGGVGGVGTPSPGFCTRRPFDPRSISLIRLAVVTRSKGADSDPAWVPDPGDPTNVPGQDRSRINDSNYCRPAMANRLAAVLGSAQCGFVYRTYTIDIQPRSTGPLYRQP